MNELSPEACRRLLTESDVGHLAVISQGDPYVSPISYVLKDDAICLRTGPGRRIDAIRQNPRVCVEVSEYDKTAGTWESVIVWGEAEFVDDPHVAQAIIIEILDKYRDVISNPLSPSGGMPEEELILRIPIDEQSGRTSGSLFSVRRRPGRL